MKNTVALEYYTIRGKFKLPEDFALVSKKVKEMGYDGYECGAWQAAPIIVKELGVKTGLKCVCVSADYNTLLTGAEKLAGECLEAGVNHVMCPWFGEKGKPRDFALTGKELSKAGKILAEKGITLMYHNHNFEFTKIKGKLGLDILYEESDSRYLKAELDTYWLAAGGLNPVKYIQKMKGRIGMAHLKDMRGGECIPLYAEIGEGNLAWNEIIPAFKEAGVTTFIVEQDETYERDSLESARISRENLKKYGL